MSRVEALRIYMLNLLDELLNNEKSKINVNYLDSDSDSYSLNKIPTQRTVYKWITGDSEKKDVYNFTSRKSYSVDTITNLANLGFFESLEEKIESNNEKGILPDIEGIKSIECLNCGALSSANTQDCIFAIQIQITYRRYKNDNN